LTKLILILFLAFAAIVSAKTITREEALSAAFPVAQIKSDVVFLTDAEKEEIEKSSDSAVTTSLVARYRAMSNGKEIGRAYLDTHVVRTKKESLLVMLNADGTLKRVEVVAFLEPPEYKPSERWYKQFEGKSQTSKFRLNSDIHAVTGATLTGKATTEAVRRVIAIDTLLQKRKS
jgi:Na+-translocating ferredoxin:NAD+ oxidoreductase RnfG subunit